ncbi:ANTAR domain-containing protein [Streptomyces alfalfae]|uniref:ANTAR domain-containing protein n=1 Tax=Streptomyces alfalfae TaxID=1642299 RepID=A0A7T4U1S1_9ACTN|nr:ANTAR domain-containing protein [Streptomyces alfalfae]QQC93168.1 ANTAR domain-containing protein [Streptomyces alfalfae]
MPEPAHSEQPLTGDGSDGAEEGRDSRPPLPAMPLPATLDTVPDGARVGVIVRGELDLDACQRLRPDMLHALSRSAEGLDLYLSEVAFCDCSGVNLLLALRRLALRYGKTVLLRTTSPAVERVLDLTATHALFEPHMSEDPARDGFEDGAAPGVAGGDAHAGGRTEQELRTIVSQLQRAMRTRPTIDLARGILMSAFTLSPEAAWEVLVTASQNTNTKLHRLAGHLVDTVTGDQLPPAVRQQLANAVAQADKARATPPTEGSTAGPPAAAAEPSVPRPSPERPVNR